MSSGKGLYLPGKDGEMTFRGIAEPEERPILSYEEDTGVIFLNFNAILAPKFRKLRDITIITEGGQARGIVLSSMAMGPDEKARMQKEQKV